MEPFRVLTIGDPHLMKSAVREYRIMIEEIIKRAERVKPDLICVLGDTLHDKENIKMNILKDAIDFFIRLSKISKLAVLIGNHDREVDRGFNKDVHPFIGLKESSDIIVVNEVLDIIVGEDMRFILVPYVEPGEFHNELSKLSVSIDKHKPLAIFGHQEIRGCSLSTNYSSDNGDIWRVDEPLLILGHIHKRHKPQDNVHYVGTPRQVHINEDEDKGVTVYDFFPNNVVKERFYKLDVPIKGIMEATVDDILSITESQQSMQEFIDSFASNNVKLEIRVKGKYDEVKPLIINTKVRELRDKGVIVKPYYTDNKSSNNISSNNSNKCISSETTHEDTHHHPYRMMSSLVSRYDILKNLIGDDKECVDLLNLLLS